MNREVENRPGEETDIRVEAFRTDQNGKRTDVLTLVIEVKGCWHEKLWSAMESQLVTRYMSLNRTNVGVYVVGWFLCKDWEKEPRLNRTPKKDIGDVRLKLAEQARTLTTETREVRAVVLDTHLPGSPLWFET